MSKIQLFCFTYAGGKGSFFNTIEKDLPDLDLVKIDYAGHGSRYNESLYKSFEELSEDIFRKLKESSRGGAYALFGYSMGCITAVEVLKRIQSEGMRMPEAVFLAAHEPHSKSELIGFTADELDDWVKERTIRFGGIPEKLIHNRSFWRLYLPLYRTDYSIIARYLFENLNLQTDIPLTVFYSETDTPREEMEKWKKYFTGKSRYECYEGSHFFIQQHHSEMAEVILDELDKQNSEAR